MFAINYVTHANVACIRLRQESNFYISRKGVYIKNGRGCSCWQKYMCDKMRCF